jgi:hypothetical protein
MSLLNFPRQETVVSLKHSKKIKLDPSAVYIDPFDEFLRLFTSTFFEGISTECDYYGERERYDCILFDPLDDETITKMLTLLKSSHTHTDYPLHNKSLLELRLEYSKYRIKYQQSIVEKLFSAMKLKVEWKWDKDIEMSRVIYPHLFLAWHMYIRLPEFTTQDYNMILRDVWNDQSMATFENNQECVQNARDEKLVIRMKHKIFTNHMIIPLQAQFSAQGESKWIFAFSEDDKKKSRISFRLNYFDVWVYRKGQFQLRYYTGVTKCYLPFNLLHQKNISSPFPFSPEYVTSDLDLEKFTIPDLHELHIGTQWYEYYAGRPASFYYRLNWFPSTFNNDLIQLILEFLFLPCNRKTETITEDNVVLTTITTKEKNWKVAQYTRQLKRENNTKFKRKRSSLD